MNRLFVVCLLALFSAPAMAYLGPGAGLGVIGVVFGVFAALVLAVFGLFWYPLKRALKKKKAAAGRESASSVDGNGSSDQPNTVPTRPGSPAADRPEDDLARQPEVADEMADSSMEDDSDSQVR